MFSVAPHLIGEPISILIITENVPEIMHKLSQGLRNIFNCALLGWRHVDWLTMSQFVMTKAGCVDAKIKQND